MKRLMMAVWVATFAMGGTAAFAQASGAMGNDAMSQDAMGKNAMSHDGMDKGGMSHGSMSKDKKMKKHDAMGMDHAASGTMAK